MPKALPPIKLPSTDDPKTLSKAVEKELNELVLRLNRPAFTNILDMNENRIINLGRCVEQHDAVNLECLKKHLDSLNIKRVSSGNAVTTTEITGLNELEFQLTDAIFPDESAGDGNRSAVLVKRRMGLSASSSDGANQTSPNFWELMYRANGTGVLSPGLNQNADGDVAMWMGRLPIDFSINDMQWNIGWKVATDPDEQFFNGVGTSPTGDGTAVNWGVAIQTWGDGDYINIAQDSEDRFPAITTGSASGIAGVRFDYSGDINSYNITTINSTNTDTSDDSNYGPLNQLSWNVNEELKSKIDFTPGRLFIVALKRGRGLHTFTLDWPLQVVYFTLTYSRGS